MRINPLESANALYSIGKNDSGCDLASRDKRRNTGAGVPIDDPTAGKVATVDRGSLENPFRQWHQGFRPIAVPYQVAVAA